MGGNLQSIITSADQDMKTDNSEFLFERLSESLQTGSFVKLTLGKYRGEESNLKNVFVRLVQLKNTVHLSFLYRYQTKDIVKNVVVNEGVKVIRSLLGESFFSGHLFTLNHDFQVLYNKKHEPRFTSRAPTFTTQPTTTHNVSKHRYLDPKNNYYLKALGLTTDKGEIKNRMGHKWRQVNRFIEIVENLYESSSIAGSEEISVVDMGSGKGYLTFAVYDYFNNLAKIRARVTGVEAKKELVMSCNEIARESGFLELSFQPGFIQSYKLSKVDILIALHACDTATDEAIYKGISAKASVIICAPCCHKQIRLQIKSPPTLKGILKFGILLERQAEMVTDGLRALLLEYSGYTTKVFEFISIEHTQKNTMIVGLRQNRKRDRDQILRQIGDIKQFFGITDHYLEQLLFGGC